MVDMIEPYLEFPPFKFVNSPRNPWLQHYALQSEVSLQIICKNMILQYYSY